GPSRTGTGPPKAWTMIRVTPSRVLATAKPSVHPVRHRYVESVLALLVLLVRHVRRYGGRAAGSPGVGGAFRPAVGHESFLPCGPGATGDE
ncbi:hypothetical protein, partial [Streptomyces sp. NPDC006863]|uniref:hypothetical protein n=1 Tax=Streptomyces sp. NPDC006863 TaxID=3154779 RepID=UPI0033E4431D